MSENVGNGPEQVQEASTGSEEAGRCPCVMETGRAQAESFRGSQCTEAHATSVIPLLLPRATGGWLQIPPFLDADGMGNQSTGFGARQLLSGWGRPQDV